MNLLWYKDDTLPKFCATRGDIDVVRLPGRRAIWVARHRGVRISKQEHAKPEAAQAEASVYYNRNSGIPK